MRITLGNISYNYLITNVCYVIINSFGGSYLDLQLVIATFQMYLLKNKFKKKSFVVAILVYKITVKNTILKMCQLDSLTSKMYT